MKYTRHIVAIFFLALGVRLCLLLAAGSDPARLMRPDSGSYLTLAQNLAHSGAFTMEPGPGHDPEFWRTPGYPAWLSLVGASTRWNLAGMMAIQAVLGAMIPVLTFAFARRFVREEAALVAGILVALDNPSACHSILVLTETLFVGLLLLAWMSLERTARTGSARWGALSGLLLTALTMVRPVAGYFPALAAAWLLVVDRSPWRRKAVTLATLLALAQTGPGLWRLRNAWQGNPAGGDELVLQNMLEYRAAPVLARARSWPRDRAYRELLAQVQARSGETRGGPLTTGAWDDHTRAAMKHVAGTVLVKNPASLVAMVLDGCARAWLGAGTSDLMVILGVTDIQDPGRMPSRGSWPARAFAWVLLALVTAMHFVVLILIARGLNRLFQERDRALLPVVLLTLIYFTLLPASPGAYARFRVPMVPFAAMLAAVGLLPYLERQGIIPRGFSGHF